MFIKTITFKGFNFIKNKKTIRFYIFFKHTESGNFNNQSWISCHYSLSFQLIRKWFLDMWVTLAVLHIVNDIEYEKVQ